MLHRCTHLQVMGWGLILLLPLVLLLSLAGLLEDATADVQKLLNAISLDRCFKRKLWPHFRGYDTYPQLR